MTKNQEKDARINIYLESKTCPYADHYARLASEASDFHKEIIKLILEENGVRKIVHSSFEIINVNIEGKDQDVLCHKISIRRDAVTIDLFQQTLLDLLKIYKKYSLEMIDSIPENNQVYEFMNPVH